MHLLVIHYVIFLVFTADRAAVAGFGQYEQAAIRDTVFLECHTTSVGRTGRDTR